MGLLKKKIAMPEASRFDRLDDQTLFLLVEQSMSTALHMFQAANASTDEKVLAHLDNCHTALSDARLGVAALLRRKLSLQ